MITDMVYSPQERRVRIDLIGHPTDSLAHALQIGDATLGDEPWYVAAVEGKFMGPLTSDFRMKVIMQQRTD